MVQEGAVATPLSSCYVIQVKLTPVDFVNYESICLKNEFVVRYIRRVVAATMGQFDKTFTSVIFMCSYCLRIRKQ